MRRNMISNSKDNPRVAGIDAPFRLAVVEMLLMRT
jgi:hypothetical protein